MTEFLASAWWLVVSLGILVTIHEFGHFWVARRCGVRVLRFSIGFGRALWRRLGAHREHVQDRKKAHVTPLRNCVTAEVRRRRCTELHGWSEMLRPRFNGQSICGS